jgi:glycosyltransferase involved in cell wall biosynthesis
LKAFRSLKVWEKQGDAKVDPSRATCSPHPNFAPLSVPSPHSRGGERPRPSPSLPHGESAKRIIRLGRLGVTAAFLKKLKADCSMLFDARVLQPHFPGIGRYARALLEALARVAPTLPMTLLTQAGAERLALPQARWLEAPPIFSPASQVQIPWLARRSGATLFHAPYYLYPYLVPLPTVVTIHDLIPLEYPEMIPAGLGKRLYRPLHQLAARRAARVLTDSEGARNSILRHLKVPPEKVKTVLLAPDPFFTPDPSLARERFFFSLLTNKPHKNGARLIRAFAATDPATHGVRLHFAGGHDPDWPSFEQLAEEAGVQEWVTVLGWPSDEGVRDAYRRCLAFVFPSFVEGFGLPVLEAMACAAPTAIADAAPMRDLAAEAALRFDPFDESAIASTLRRLIHEEALRTALSAQALARATDFTWERTARETLAVYEEVA